MPVRSTVLRISLLALLVALVASTPLVHGKPTESSQGAVDSLSRRVDELSTRQKMWEEVQDRSRSEWIAVQKELQAAHQESAKQNQSAAVKEVKDLIAEFKDGYDSKFAMVDKWVSNVNATMQIFYASLALFVGLASIGSWVSFKNVKASLEEQVKESLRVIKKDIEDKKIKIEQLHSEALRGVESVQACEESALRKKEAIEMHCDEIFSAYKFSVNAGVVENNANIEGERGEPLVDPAEKLFQCAEELKAKGDLSGAECVLRRVVELRPDDDVILMDYATLCGRLGVDSASYEDKRNWTSKAEQIFKNVADKNGSVVAWLSYGAAALNLTLLTDDGQQKLEKSLEAVAALEQAEKLQPLQVEIIRMLAIVYNIAAKNAVKRAEAVGYAEKSVAYAQSVLEQDKNDGVAILAVAYGAFLITPLPEMMDSDEKREAAKAATLRALEWCKKYESVSCNAATLYYNLALFSKNTDKRVHNFKNVLDVISRVPIGEKSERMYNLEVGCWLNCIVDGQHPEETQKCLQRAENAYRERENRYPNSIHYNDACLEARQGRCDAAIRILEQLLMLGRLPSHREILTDADLVGLRDMDEFKSIIERRKNQEEQS